MRRIGGEADPLGALALGDQLVWRRDAQSLEPEAGVQAGRQRGLHLRRLRDAWPLALGRKRSVRFRRRQRGAVARDCGRPLGWVPRTGAMALSWSMDKLGPICRAVEDCALVLEAIYGPDGGRSRA